jgi:quinoprotein glucose dehydrogenase
MYRYAVALPLVAAVALALAFAVPPADPKDKQKTAKSAADESLAQVKLADKGLKVSVWANEPTMANPVSFCFDEKGRCFVAETTRFEHGVPDTRGHMQWLDEDLANRSIDDLLAMYKKHNYKGFEKYADQVRMVWDSTGSGKADKSTVFAGGFNRPQDGLAAGVLARKGQVYFACIPDLYVLKDTNGDGKADEKKTLFTGFGPTAQFLGHDLHGLRMGPDGKLYFSIGDRGFNVTTKEGKKLEYPNTGAVLRCDPDGANLEVVHMGLRNPQELAFDDYGNLFTYDNNSDSGDRARWVHVVEGGDSGWRGGFQYGTLYHTPGVPQGNRGPWNVEKLWIPQHEGQPAYVVPPLLNFGNGPAGITHYPGLGLNDKYRDHFFACDFTSNAGSSKIWALAVKPKGAGFEVSKGPEPFVQGMVPTDCEFGPDGAFYWSDWVGGWAPQNRGRIFRVTDAEAMKNPQVAEAQKLLAEGFDKKSTRELRRLLFHPHQQVRTEAHIAMAEETYDMTLVGILHDLKNSKDRTNQIAKLHAIWGLGLYDRLHPGKWTGWGALVEAVKEDSDPVVRAAALKTLASLAPIPAEVPGLLQKELKFGRESLARLLGDPDAQVQAAAAVLYGRIGHSLATTPAGGGTFYLPLFDLLKSNNDKDPYLRHAAVMGLYHAARNPADLVNGLKAAKDKYDVPAVRMGVLLALRKHKSDKCAEFFTDSDPRIVAEAARAVYDVRLRDAMPALAELAEKPGQPDAIAFRALAANYILGTPEAAARVANFAARQSEPDYTRAFALKLLGNWTKPPRRDPIMGVTLDLPARDAKVATEALLKAGAGIFAGSDVVRKEAAQTVAKLNAKEFGSALAAQVKDAKNPVSVRAESLAALDALKDAQVKELANFALESNEPKLRAAGRAVQAHLDPAAVLKELPALLKHDKVSLAEKQGAFAILAEQKSSEQADKLLDSWLDRLKAGQVPAALVLDILDAAESRAKAPKLKLHAPLKKKVDEYRAAQAKAASAPNGDKLAAYSDALEGGDAEKGRSVFLNNAAVYCQRCHKLDGQGGEVGPMLNGIAADREKGRHYLLESVAFPSAKIAKGYDTVILLLADETTVSGVVKSEDKKQIKLVTPENKEVVVPTADVLRRRTGPSAMPDDLVKKLSRRELRDVVEFLSSLKEPPRK